MVIVHIKYFLLYYTFIDYFNIPQYKKELKVMKPTIIVLIYLSLLFPLSLSDIVDSTFHNSGLVSNSNLTLENNKLEYKKVRSELMPQISISGNYRYFGQSYDRYGIESDSNATEKYISKSSDISRIPDRQDLIITNIVDQYVFNRPIAPKKNGVEFNLNIYQPIYQQGKVASKLKIIKAVGSRDICDWQLSYMRVKSQVAKEYYNYLLSSKILELYKKELTIKENQHQITKELYVSGNTLETDTMNSYLSLFQAKNKISSLEEKKNNAYIALKKLSGIKDSLVITDSLTVLYYPISYDSAYNSLLEKNKKITKLNGDIEIAKEAIKIERGNFFPTINAGLNLSRISTFNNSDFFYLAPERSLFFNINYNLISFGKRNAGIKLAENNLTMLENKLEDTKKNVAIEFKAKWSLKNKKESELNNYTLAINNSKKLITISQQLYENGNISLDKLNNIEEQLINLKIDYYKKIYEYNSTIIDIRVLTADYIYEIE